MSIQSQSPLSPTGEENEYGKASPTFSLLLSPLEAHLPYLTPLTSRCNKPMTYTFDHQVRGLVYYHIEACSSAQDLLQAAGCDGLANQLLVPPSGLGQSTFYEANTTRGKKQMFELFSRLSKTAAKKVGLALPRHRGLIAIDGSFVDACLSMTWADYSRHKRKAKLHFGFDLNGAIPRKIFLSDGKAAERPFVSLLLEKGQTGVMDRGSSMSLHGVEQGTMPASMRGSMTKSTSSCASRKTSNITSLSDWLFNQEPINHEARPRSPSLPRSYWVMRTIK